ncbi:unnamed protein product, partial [Symbiodinium sp. CCMP2592]
ALFPAKASHTWGPESEEVTGVAADREWAPEYLYGTDGTAGGHGNDPCGGRVAAWSVVIFQRAPDGLKQVGSACGVLPPGTTVPQAEAYAIARVCARTPGVADITTDCFGMLRQQKSLVVNWPWLQGGDRRAHASLTRSHVTEDEFRAEFGESSLWRKQVNDAADHLCQKAGHGPSGTMVPGRDR